MKRIILATLLLVSLGANAQLCIPDPAVFSKKLANCLQKGDTLCFLQYYPTWIELEPMVDMMIKKESQIPNRAIPPKDSIKKEMEAGAHKDLSRRADSLFAKSKRMGINWDSSLVELGDVKIEKEYKMPFDFYLLNGSFSIKSGDTLYGIRYEAILLNNQWKLVSLRDRIWLHDTNGQLINYMDDVFDNDLNYDSAMAVVDSAAATIDTTEFVPQDASKKRAVSKRSSTKKAPIKKTTKPKQAIRKPE